MFLKEIYSKIEFTVKTAFQGSWGVFGSPLSMGQQSASTRWPRMLVPLVSGGRSALHGAPPFRSGPLAFQRCALCVGNVLISCHRTVKSSCAWTEVESRGQKLRNSFMSLQVRDPC